MPYHFVIYHVRFVKKPVNLKKTVWFLQYAPCAEAISMSKIIEKTKADKLLLELTCHIQQGYIPKLAKSSISDDSLLMRGNKIILPETLWDTAFSKAHHGGQQGINSLKRCYIVISGFHN